MTVAISKQDTPSNGQTNQAAFYKEYAAICGSSANSSACSMYTISQVVCSQSEIMMNVFARNQYERE